MKKTGKALSLVLSLALVASSLTTAFASAASTSETASASLGGNDTVYLCNGGTNAAAQFDVGEYLAPTTGNVSIKTADGYSIKDSMHLKELAITSGSNYATLAKPHKDNDGYIDSQLLTLTSSTKTGTVTVAARYQGTIERGEDGATDVTAYASTTLTLKILQNGSAYFCDESKVPATGHFPDSVTMDKSPLGVQKTLDVVTASYGTDAKAIWNTATTDGTAGNFVVAKSSSANSLDVTTSPAVTVKTTTAGSLKVASGSVSFTATKLDANGKTTSTKATTTVKVANSVTAIAGNIAISSYGGRTWLYTKQVTSPAEEKAYAAQDVTNADVLMVAPVTMYGGTIGKISGTFGFDLEKGTVGSVNHDVTSFTMNGGTVNGTIGVGGSVASVDINAGSTGAIDGSTVNIESQDTGKPITTGDISAKNLTVISTDASTVKVGKITATDLDSQITLTGNDVTVGQINSNYNNTFLKLEGFVGTIAAPTNAYTVGVSADHHGINVEVDNTNDLNSNVTVTGNATIPSLDVSEGTINFTGSLTAGKLGNVSGAGVLGIEPNGLYSQGSISGVSMKLLSNFKVGDTVFTADTGLVDSDSFTPFGFTLNATEGKTKDTFKVASTNFAGLTISGPATVVKGATATYTAAAYPSGLALPTGDSVAWSFDGNGDVFDFASNGATATVKATSIDGTFPNNNKGTLTAKVVDANGDEVADYPAATYDVTAVVTPAVTVDSLPTNMKAGQQYTVKITSSDSTKATIAFADNFAVITKTSTSGNATFVTFTAKTAGEHGVYVAGNKVAIIKVAGSICDTPTVTKKAGQPYTFKVTSPTNAAPTFVVAGIGSIKASKVSGHDYYFMVKATANKGVHGVYVNGAAISLYTFA